MADLKGLISRWIQKVIVDSVNVILPTDIQARYSETVQTHSGVAIAPDTSSSSAYFGCDKFDKVGIAVRNDGYTAMTVRIAWSHDGVNIHGQEAVLTDNMSRFGYAITEVKAPYMYVSVENGDTAAPHTFSAYAYLKA